MRGQPPPIFFLEPLLMLLLLVVVCAGERTDHCLLADGVDVVDVDTQLNGDWNCTQFTHTHTHTRSVAITDDVNSYVVTTTCSVRPRSENDKTAKTF